MKLKVILTGATGMVGEGVLLECLENPTVEQVLIINRRPSGYAHPKLREIIHSDLMNLTPVESQLAGYNACFFCAGISSVGIAKDEYKKITQDLTLGFAAVLEKLNPEMTFIYVSGAGTDSTEQGNVAWARVKGATENALMRMFKNAFMYRPGMMKATKGQKHLLKLYNYFAWIYPIGRALFPGGFCTLREVARAMINMSVNGYPKKIIDVRDMVAAGQ